MNALIRYLCMAITLVTLSGLLLFAWPIVLVLGGPVLLGVPNGLFVRSISRRYDITGAWWLFALACVGAAVTLLALCLLPLLLGRAIDAGHAEFGILLAYVFGYCPIIWISVGFLTAIRGIKRGSARR